MRIRDSAQRYPNGTGEGQPARSVMKFGSLEIEWSEVLLVTFEWAYLVCSMAFIPRGLEEIQELQERQQVPRILARMLLIDIYRHQLDRYLPVPKIPRA